MTTYDDILIAQREVELSLYGESVTVTPPDAAARVCTAIVHRADEDISDDPRTRRAPVTVSLPNDAASGISAEEWNNRFTVTLPRRTGATTTVILRTIRPVQQDAALITWELG